MQKVLNNIYKVTYTATCIKVMPSSKKGSIGVWRKVGEKIEDWEAMPLNFAEPTEELVKSAIQFCNPHLIVETVKWQLKP